MERDKYLKEVELTLAEIVKDEEITEIIKATLQDCENKMVFNAFRYGKGPIGMGSWSTAKAGEEFYNKILKIKKARNLIDYLLLLAENKDK